MRRLFPVMLILLLTGCRMQQTSVPQSAQLPPQLPAQAAVSEADTYAAAWAESVRMLSAPETALLLHDHLVSRVTFDKSAARRHTAEGALTDGLAVCDGYAAAFCLLGNAAGLPCRMITGIRNGVPHAWNLICLDGAWYHVDCAADDADAGSPLHTRFLCADSDMDGYAWIHSDYPAAAGGTWSYPAIVQEMHNAAPTVRTNP